MADLTPGGGFAGIAPAAIPDLAVGPPFALVVPMPPSLTNSGSGRSRHFRAVSREKRQYWDTLDALVTAGRIPAPPAAPFARARFSSVMFLGNAMDTDNAVSRHKYLIDWLRTRGYVAEDRRDVLVWGAFPEQRIERGQGYRIAVTLVPLAPLAAAPRRRKRRPKPTGPVEPTAAAARFTMSADEQRRALARTTGRGLPPERRDGR